MEDEIGFSSFEIFVQDEENDDDEPLFTVARSPETSWDEVDAVEDEPAWRDTERVAHGRRERKRYQDALQDARNANLRQRKKPGSACDCCGKERRRVTITDAYVNSNFLTRTRSDTESRHPFADTPQYRQAYGQPARARTRSINYLLCASCVNDTALRQSPTLGIVYARLLETWLEKFDTIDTLMRSNGITSPYLTGDGDLGPQLDRGRGWMDAEVATVNEIRKRAQQDEQRDEEKRANLVERKRNAAIARARLEEVAASITTVRTVKTSKGWELVKVALFADLTEALDSRNEERRLIDIELARLEREGFTRKELRLATSYSAERLRDAIHRGNKACPVAEPLPTTGQGRGSAHVGVVDGDSSSAATAPSLPLLDHQESELSQTQYKELNAKLDAILARIEDSALDVAQRFPHDHEVAHAVEQLIASALGQTQEAA